jgi:hypothetical protein
MGGGGVISSSSEFGIDPVEFAEFNPIAENRADARP